MFDRRSHRMRAAAAAAAMVAVLAIAPAASAHRGGSGAKEVVVRGECSATTVWRLRLVQHRRWIGVGFGIDSEVAGELWRIRIDHGDAVVFADLRITSDPEGLIGVRRPIRNGPGLDFVRAKAMNVGTGEICLARAAI
jgi:hypothetical protein